MDKLSRLFIRRLRQIARREACRHAQLNGLLEVKIIGIGGHVMRRYTPAFDTSRLTGDRESDLVWLRRNFGSYLQAPLMPSDTSRGRGSRDPGDTTAAHGASSLPASAWPAVVSGPGRRQGSGNGRSASTNTSASAIAGAGALNAYAVRLIGEAGAPPLVANIAAALVLARAVGASSVPLGRMLRIVSRSAPVVSLHAPVIGFERAMLRLIETPGFIPGSGTPTGVDGDYVFNDHTFDVTEEVGRIFVQFVGENVHRLTGSGLKLRLLNALARDYPVVAIAEKRKHIPDEIIMTADIDLATGWLDYPFVSSMIEALYGVEASAVLDTWLNAYDAHHLTLDDVILAFRPGRDAFEAVAVLARLTERNRLAALDEDDGEGDRTATTTGSKPSASKAAATTGSGKPATATPADNSRGKRDKPSGAEVIQPERLPEGDDDGAGKPVLTVETLSGYGKAKDWAFDLKADLGDYRAGELGWSQMSSKLLLSGPPGTGKTTFARALCNSLQLPLVVTSVSTWLQGGHLNDVISKLANTFAEARALAPAILFIDEIDGIGKRQPADREYSDYWNAIVNKALELLDGAVRSEGLIIIGATNRPGEIDEALKRSGRLETHIEIPKPDTATLTRIFAHHLGDDVEGLVNQAGSVGEESERDMAGEGEKDEPPEAEASGVEAGWEGQGSERSSAGSGPAIDGWARMMSKGEKP